IELTDTQLGAALWFSKLDERFLDLFEVQDRLSEMIVRQVAPHLHAAEMRRIRVKRPDSLEAHDLVLRAQENMHSSSPSVSAPAWLWSAAANVWIGDGSRAIEEINKAMALSPYDPLMYAYSGVAGMAYLADGQYERAIECGLRSLRENRTYTHAYRLLVMALVLAGREEEARASARRLLALEPGLTVAGFRRRYPGSACPQAD